MAQGVGWGRIVRKKRQMLKNTVNLQQKVNKKFGFMIVRKISRKVNSRLMEGLQKWQGKKQVFFEVCSNQKTNAWVCCLE